MTNHLVHLAGVAIVLGGIGILGCDRTELGSGDSHGVEAAGAVGAGSDYPPPSTSTSAGTGNGPTTAGTGATNSVVGNETLNWVSGPGNTESGRGTTTRPSDQVR